MLIVKYDLKERTKQYPLSLKYKLGNRMNRFWRFIHLDIISSFNFLYFSSIITFLNIFEVDLCKTIFIKELVSITIEYSRFNDYLTHHIYIHNIYITTLFLSCIYTPNHSSVIKNTYIYLIYKTFSTSNNITI